MDVPQSVLSLSISMERTVVRSVLLVRSQLTRAHRGVQPRQGDGRTSVCVSGGENTDCERLRLRSADGGSQTSGLPAVCQPALAVKHNLVTDCVSWRRRSVHLVTLLAWPDQAPDPDVQAFSGLTSQTYPRGERAAWQRFHGAAAPSGSAGLEKAGFGFVPTPGTKSTS